MLPLSVGAVPERLQKVGGSLTVNEEKVMKDYPEIMRGHPIRKFVFTIVRSKPFEMLIGAVMLFNLVVVILETDDEVNGGSSTSFDMLNEVLLGIYATELAAKFFSYRWRFFREYWNLFDLFIVGLDFLFLAFGGWLENAPSLNFLRIFRLARLLRAFRMASMFPELNLLMKGFFGSVRAIFWGLLMVCLFLSVWSILAVKFLHPINEKITERGGYAGCDRCPHAFSTVWNSSLTFFQQVVAGDSWGTVSLPIIEEEWWTAFFFLAVLVSVSLAMLNLILAVICEAATEARQSSLNDLAEEHELEMRAHRQKMLDFCAGMDGDKSGSVSYKELVAGWDTSPEFAQTLTVMDVKKEDMEMIFKVLDTDGSGDVRYEEFVDQLHMLKTNEVRLILFTVMEILSKSEERFKALQKEVEELGLGVNKEVVPLPPPPATGHRPEVGAMPGLLPQQLQAPQEVQRLPLEQPAMRAPPAPSTPACDVVLLDKILKASEELAQAVTAMSGMNFPVDRYLANEKAQDASGILQKKVTQAQGGTTKDTMCSSNSLSRPSPGRPFPL